MSLPREASPIDPRVMIRDDIGMSKCLEQSDLPEHLDEVGFGASHRDLLYCIRPWSSAKVNSTQTRTM